MATTRTPKFARIRDELIAAIRSGTYPERALLPSVREVVTRWGVSTTTARRALGELVLAGYARPDGTRGHVSLGPPALTPGSPIRTMAQQSTGTVTVDEAIGNAARILRHAEGETNLALMERLEKLADSWLVMAQLLVDRDKD